MDAVRDRLAGFVIDTGVPGAVAGVSVAGERDVTAAGCADLTTSRPVRRDTPFRVASLTKTVTSAATVLACRSAGHDLDAPVATLFPELADDWTADPDLSLAHLLGQVSGLRESVDATQLAALGDGADALPAGARLVASAGQEHRPGLRWSYYNGNYFLAGAALARLAATPYEDAVRRFVLRPWSLTRTGFTTPSAPALGHLGGDTEPETGYPRARRPSGGLWSTVDDLLTVGERLLADRDLLAETRRPRTPAESAMRYGLGWALGDGGQLYLNGRLRGYRAILLTVPDRGLVTAMLVNADDALPAMSGFVSEIQRPYTGEDLAVALDAFAA